MAWLRKISIFAWIGIALVLLIVLAAILSRAMRPTTLTVRTPVPEISTPDDDATIGPVPVRVATVKPYVTVRHAATARPAATTRSCCMHCGASSKPCGNSCISKSKNCTKPPGCACP